MSKNNKKQHRTDGVFNSNNETYAVPQTSRNTPLSDYKFTDLEKIERESQIDRFYKRYSKTKFAK